MDVEMTKKNIFVICTVNRDRRELSAPFFQHNYNIHFQDYDSTIEEKVMCGCIDNPPMVAPEKTLEELLNYCVQHKIDGVVSSDDYAGSIFASVVSKHLGLIGPPTESVLTCQHKYYSRVMQNRFIPEATPDFKLIDPEHFKLENFAMQPPLFIKPVKSSFSAYANRVNNHAELENIVKTSLPPELYLQLFNWFLNGYSSYDLNANYLLAETLLEGNQVTLEGFVQHGKTEIIGIVDSIMYPGTFIFERFEYPSNLSASVQARMGEIARRFIEGIKLDNTLFNIEMIYNPHTDAIHIIEINPRMASQFTDLYEKVDGINTYKILLDLALGNKPEFNKKNHYKIAASFVLRRFDDKLVKRIPSAAHLAELHDTFSDLRIEISVKEGEYLSSILQDGKSFRYGYIHLGANTREELFAKFEHCKAALPFEFI